LQVGREVGHGGELQEDATTAQGHLALIQCIIDLLARPASEHKVGVPQDGQVMRYGRLGDRAPFFSELSDDLANG
jgi:hypothetical protein